MSSTGFQTFDETVQRTNEILKDIEREFDWGHRRNQSYSALKTVLHALRDRLTVQEAADFAAQLPLLVKGIFYDGYQPAKVPKRIDTEEFLNEVRKQFPFSIDGEITDVIYVVLKALSNCVSKGELEDIFAILPKKLSTMLQKGIGGV